LLLLPRRNEYTTHGAGTPVVTSLASDDRVGYWTLKQRTVAVIEGSPKEHDSQVIDTTPCPGGSPGRSISKGNGMVRNREDVKLWSKWIACIFTTGYADQRRKLFQ